MSLTVQKFSSWKSLIVIFVLFPLFSDLRNKQLASKKTSCLYSCFTCFIHVHADGSSIWYVLFYSCFL